MILVSALKPNRIFAREFADARVVVSSSQVKQSRFGIKFSTRVLQGIHDRICSRSALAERIKCVRLRERSCSTSQRRNRTKTIGVVEISGTRANHGERRVDVQVLRITSNQSPASI